MLNIDLKDAIKELKKRRAKRVAVQLPEGLKQIAIDIVSKVEKGAGCEVVLFVEPCYGACDVPLEKAKAVSADLVLHVGHAEMVKGLKGVVYAPLSYKVDERKIKQAVKNISSELEKAGAKKVGLCAPVQYVPLMEKIGKRLGKKGIKCRVGEGNSRIAEKGQILGCNFSAVKNVEKGVDALVFVGDGEFHPIGISYSSEKPLVVVEPVTGFVRKFSTQEKERFLRKRFVAIEEAKRKKSFAVAMSTKRGQFDLESAEEIKKMLTYAGKKVVFVAGDLLKPEYFEGTGIEVVVSTACPRIVVDDASLYRQVLLSRSEVEIMLGKRELEDYVVG